VAFEPESIVKTHGLRVAFVGNLAGIAHNLQQALGSLDVQVDLFVAAWETGVADPGPEAITNLPKHCRIIRYGTPAWTGGLIARILRRLYVEATYLPLLFKLARYDVVHAFSGTLFFSFASLVFFGVLRLKPYVASAMGSDLREYAALHRGWTGFYYRLFFRRAAKVYLSTFDLFPAAAAAGLGSVAYLPFPLDLRRYHPMAVADRPCSAACLLLFMPSNLDWGEADHDQKRQGTKENDRVIRAFARLLEQGQDGHLVLLDRGSDRQNARRLIAELGISVHVTILEAMTKDALIRHFNMADVVADQFGIGALGGVAMEAMSCAKPVIVYLDVSAAERAYAELPPVANARSEDEILAALARLSDRQARDSLGREARRWMERHHAQEAVGRQLIADYVTMCFARA
jgi:glycosyltransferase involved in cell wall biosynthesis